MHVCTKKKMLGKNAYNIEISISEECMCLSAYDPQADETILVNISPEKSLFLC